MSYNPWDWVAMSLRSEALVAVGLSAGFYAGCSARSAGTAAGSTGGGSSGEGVMESSSSTSPAPAQESSGSGFGPSSSSSTSSGPGPDLGPDACPQRTLDEPRTLSVVHVDPDLDAYEPFPKYGLHSWLCTATALLDRPSADASLELDCIESTTGDGWRHEVLFSTQWPLALAGTLIGEQDLRLEYYASWGGFSIGPVQYSLRDADGDLLIWTTSHAIVCDPSVYTEDECNLALSMFEEPLAQPEPFAGIVPVDDGCGLRQSWQGDFYPSHSGGYVPPEIVRRHAIQFDDDDATLIHDGRSARLTKDDHAFDVYVSSAHVAPTDPDSYSSNASLMIIRVP